MEGRSKEGQSVPLNGPFVSGYHKKLRLGEGPQELEIGALDKTDGGPRGKL